MKRRPAFSKSSEERRASSGVARLILIIGWDSNISIWYVNPVLGLICGGISVAIPLIKETSRSTRGLWI